MISAVVLTHDDEISLSRTLESLSWTDEIVAIDDFSTDGTLDILKKFHAHVFQRHLESDFSAQRNFGLKNAKGDWVLFVDSDEVVSQKLAEEIKTNPDSRFRGNDNDIQGFFIQRTDVLWGRELKHGETSRVRLLRLAQKNAGEWKRPVHEVWNIQGNVGQLDNPLTHSPHQNVAQFLASINEYSTMNARYLKSVGTKAYSWHIVAYPLAKFFTNYIWYLGFLDGTVGAIHAIMMSFHSFLTRAKLWVLYHKKNI